MSSASTSGPAIAERLGAVLVELAVAALLRPLVAVHRAAVPEALRAVVEQAVLDRGAHAGGGAFRAQRELLVVQLVAPGIHLLLDDVGRLADGAAEQRRVLDQRHADGAVAPALQPGFDAGAESDATSAISSGSTSFMPRIACSDAAHEAALIGIACLRSGCALRAGRVVVADVVLDDRLELLGDAPALERHGLLAVDVDRRDRHLVGARQADADVGVLRFARAVDHAAHHRDLHLLDARIALLPDRHLRAQVVLDALRPAPGNRCWWCVRSPGRRVDHRREAAQAHGLQHLLRDDHFAVRSPLGSGVSETRIVSPMPSCSSTAIAAVEATMPLEPMPASVRPRCSA